MLRFEAIQLLVEMCDSLDFIRSATQISLDEVAETKIVIQMNYDNDCLKTLREFVEKRNYKLEEKSNNVLVIY